LLQMQYLPNSSDRMQYLSNFSDRLPFVRNQVLEYSCKPLIILIGCLNILIPRQPTTHVHNTISSSLPGYGLPWCPLPSSQLHYKCSWTILRTLLADGSVLLSPKEERTNQTARHEKIPQICLACVNPRAPQITTRSLWSAQVTKTFKYDTQSESAARSNYYFILLLFLRFCFWIEMKDGYWSATMVAC
jgi:hypothetical protein